MSNIKIPDLPTTTIKTGLSYKLYLIVGVSIGLGIYLLWYFNIEPVHGLVNVLVVNLSVAGQQLAISLQGLASQAIAYFNAEPIPATIGVLTAAGTVYGIISKVQGDRARAETERLANQQIQETQQKLVETSQQHLAATQQITTLKDKLSAYESDTSFTEAQNVIGDLKKQLTTKTDTITELENIIESLKTKETVVVH
jgi:hypothetical protein